MLVLGFEKGPVAMLPLLVITIASLFEEDFLVLVNVSELLVGVLY